MGPYTSPYRVACRLTLPPMDIHLLLSCAARLASNEGEPVHWMMLSLHWNLGLPLHRLPSTMPSIRTRCRELCLMMCQKNKSFLIQMVPGNDRLVPANRNISSFVTRLIQLILSNHLGVLYGIFIHHFIRGSLVWSLCSRVLKLHTVKEYIW